jgi:oxalate decarboxylase/phosphoglucose isomerase-like protein (cupin superfamily)
MKDSSIKDYSIIKFPKNHTQKGNITAINNNIEVPFEINRIYYLYDIPGGESRGGHAHKKLEQLIIATSGSFEITIDDGKFKKTIQLNRPYEGLYLPSGLWRELDNFSSGSICLVLASQNYDELDYIRDYKDFLLYKGNDE